MTETQDFFHRLESLIRDSSSDSSLSTADVLAQWGCPSASVAILDHGQITSHCISSVGDDSDTLFQACSISKPTAGLALMKLFEAGILSPDDKICDRLPDHIIQHLLKDPATAPIVRTITIEHLMSHTSGMSQDGFPGYPDKDKVPSTSDIVLGGPLVNTMPIKLITLPGLDFMYSGGGITLLELIMEHTTNKPFPTIISEYVLQSLNMTRSCYSLSPSESNTTKVYYNGYLPNETPWHILPERAAAGLWTTPTDLLKLIHAIQTSLDPSTTSPFMTTASATQMLTPLKRYMGLTWFATDTQFGHSGGNAPGWCCYAYGYANLPQNANRHPKYGGLLDSGPQTCGISVMTNASNGMRAGTKLLHAINYLKGWPTHADMGMTGIGTPWPAPTGTPIPPHWKDWLDTPWSETWKLTVHQDGGPAVILADSGVVIRLVPAAIPSCKYEGERQSVELLFEGLRLMNRLCWDGKERIVEFWNEGMERRDVLRGV